MARGFVEYHWSQLATETHPWQHLSLRLLHVLSLADEQWLTHQQQTCQQQICHSQRVALLL